MRRSPQGVGSLDDEDGCVDHPAVELDLRRKPAEAVPRALYLATCDEAIDRGDVDTPRANTDAQLPAIQRALTAMQLP